MPDEVSEEIVTAVKPSVAAEDIYVRRGEVALNSVEGKYGTASAEKVLDAARVISNHSGLFDSNGNEIRIGELKIKRGTSSGWVGISSANTAYTQRTTVEELEEAIEMAEELGV